MVERVDEVRTADVVVVGSGISGSAAAMTAARAGARVALLEKLDTFGGSAALSAGMYWTAPSLDAYRKRIPLGDDELGAKVVADFEDGLAELRASGARVATTPKTDIMSFGVGYSTDIHAILAWCRDEVVKAGGEVRTCSPVVEIARSGDSATGVVVRTGEGRFVRYDADAVVLSTGGFQGARNELTRHIGPNADRLLLRSNPGSVGDGLRFARTAGAGGTSAMSTFYGHLIGYPVTHFEPADYLPFSQYYSGSTILVNLRGERFIDETLGDELLNQALTFQPEAKGVLIFDDFVRRTEGTEEPFPGLGTVDRYQIAADAGAVRAQADNLPGLLEEVSSWGIDESNLKATVESYEAAAGRGDGVVRGIPVSKNARAPQSGPFYALMVQPSITFTFGGIRIDTAGKVLDDDGRPVPGLFAAGADIGGLSNFGYAGGLAPGYLTGRWAGRSAATEAGSASD